MANGAWAAGPAALLVLLAGCQLPFGPGVQPQDYLQDGRYTSWVVEVDHSPGLRPETGVLDFARGKLAPLVHKPEGIRFVVDGTLDAGPAKWTQAQLVEQSRKHRDHATQGSQVTTHLLYVSGGFEADDGSRRVLGVAIGFDLIVVFSDSVAASCPTLALPPCAYSKGDILRAVTVHEFGHILGLVHREAADGSVPVPQKTPREDPDHPNHSSNRESVMYWAVESSALDDIFRGSRLPMDFDAADRQDLRAAGGR